MLEVGMEDSVIKEKLLALYRNDKSLNEKLNNLTTRLTQVEDQLDLVDRKYNPNLTYKDFSDIEIFEMKKSYSYEKLAHRMGCSVSTIKRICNRVKEGQHE